MTRLRPHVWVLCILLGSGCSAITDFDRFGPAEDGGTGMDGQMLVDGCVPMGDEVCNGIDDDCDGNIDENVEDDPENCGACGFVCQDVDNAAPDCAAGECVANCDTGFGDCDGAYASGCEVDLSDPDNCAACAEVCPTGEVCTAGGCATDCPGSEEVCGRTCVDTTSSTVHCGGCGMPCADRPSSVTVCAAGSCDFVCSMGFEDCDGTVDNGCETDLTTLNDCGTCGTVCSYPSGVPACTDGACELTGCMPGFDDCDLDTSNGCETDLSTTIDCGACGNACADPMSATGSCSGDGTCAFSCDTGFADCDTVESNGCEADLNSDSTCGDCTTTCSGATPLCDTGTCVSGCMSPTPTRCGGSCVNTNTDILHCGGCGTVCATLPRSTPTCAPVGASGTCGFTCDVDWADCDGSVANGCEVNIRTVVDCGSCGTACSIANGTGTCATGTCAIASCDTGFADCGSGAADGCETDITTPSDCGGCDNLCTLPNAVEACSGGACVIASCVSGYADCDMVSSNGCEELLRTYYRDDDDDGYGTGAAMQFCLASVPMRWVTMTGDCNDTDPAVNPSVTELCNGIDDNCDGSTDEGIPTMGSCGSSIGECSSGTLTCVGGSFTCVGATGPSPETCNGLDDDCDGAVDNGFECSVGSTLSCTGTVVIDGTACAFTGTQTCDAMCAWGSCDPPAETCNWVDDNCSGVVDEGLSTRLATLTIADASVFDTVLGQPHIHYNRVRNEIGVCWRAWMPGIFPRETEIFFAILSPDLSALRHLRQLTSTRTSKRSPQCVSNRDGEWFVAYYSTSGVPQLWGSYLDAAGTPPATGFTAVGGASLPMGGPQRIYALAPHSNVGEVALFHSAGISTAPDIWRATYSVAAGLTVLVTHIRVGGPELGGTNIEDLGVAFMPSSGSHSLAIAETTAGLSMVTWRQIDATGATVYSLRILPAGYAFVDRDDFSTFVGYRDTSTPADRRHVVLFYNEDTAGTFGSHYVVINDAGAMVHAGEHHRNVNRVSLGVSTAMSTFVMGEGRNGTMRDFDNVIIPPTLVASGSSFQWMTGMSAPVGNFQYLVAQMGGAAVTVDAFGCMP